MNYITQINSFYRIMQINPLSPNAQCLYHYLLNKNSELGWIECFSIANSIITGVIGIEVRQLARIRKELIDKGYIAYKKGNINNAGVYKIIEIKEEYFNKVSQNLDEKLASELWTFKSMSISERLEAQGLNYGQHVTNSKLDDTAMDITMDKNAADLSILNKRNETKRKEKEKNIYKKEIPNDFLKELDELGENEKDISEDRIREAYLGNVSGLSEADRSKEIKLEKLEEWTKEADKDKYEAGSVININDASPKDINDISMLNDELDRINRVNRVNSKNELVRDIELDRVRELEKENEFGINEFDDMNMLATNTPVTNEPKVKYGDSIYLTDQEYRTLKSIYEQYDIDLELGIEILDDYKMSSGREYKSDFHIMKSWVKKRLLEDKKKALMDENYTGYTARYTNTRSVSNYQQNNSNNYNQNNNSYNNYNQYQGRQQRSWEDFEKTLPEEWREFI